MCAQQVKQKKHECDSVSCQSAASLLGVTGHTDLWTHPGSPYSCYYVNNGWLGGGRGHRSGQTPRGAAVFPVPRCRPDKRCPLSRNAVICKAFPVKRFISCPEGKPRPSSLTLCSLGVLVSERTGHLNRHTVNWGGLMPGSFGPFMVCGEAGIRLHHFESTDLNVKPLRAVIYGLQQRRTASSLCGVKELRTWLGAQRRCRDSTLCYAQRCLKCGIGIPTFILDGDAA